MPPYSFCVVFVLLRGVLPSSRVRSAVPCGGRGVRSCSWDWELSALTLRSRAASSELAAHAPAHLTPHSLGTILSAGLSLVARRAAPYPLPNGSVGISVPLRYVSFERIKGK